MKINLNLLTEIINNNQSNQLSLSKIRELYYKKDNSVSFSRETLRKFLRKNMNCTFRRVTLKNKEVKCKNYINVQSVFLRRVIEIFLNEEDIIYIDQSGFSNPKSHFQNWTFSPNDYKGTLPKRLKRINLISALGRKELLFSKISLLKTNQRRMINFLKQLIDKLQKDEHYNDKYNSYKLWIYLDNAKFHKGNNIVDYIKTTKFNVIYGIPYTPKYDSIENVFSIIKAIYRGHIFENE